MLNNVGSAKIIERNGGVLEDRIMVGTRSVQTRRYWIELGSWCSAEYV